MADQLSKNATKRHFDYLQYCLLNFNNDMQTKANIKKFSNLNTQKFL